MIVKTIKNWWMGCQKLSQDFINGLEMEEGEVLQIRPVEPEKTSIESMEKLLYILQGYESRFSFEIWREEGYRFFFYSKEFKAFDALQRQLKTVYPEAEMKEPKFCVPELTPDLYLCAADIEVIGQGRALQTHRDFGYDPLIHILNSMEGFDLIQVIFKPVSQEEVEKLKEKYSVQFTLKMRKSSPYEVLIRILSFSKNPEEARTNCEHASASFSVFNGFKGQLSPSIRSFYVPKIYSPKSMLKNLAKRKISFFSKTSVLKIPELASIVHLPVGGEKHGVRYARRRLKPDFL